MAGNTFLAVLHFLLIQMIMVPGRITFLQVCRNLCLLFLTASFLEDLLSRDFPVIFTFSAIVP